MQIGEVAKNEAGSFVGRIVTLNLSLVIRLELVRSTNDNAPSFEIMARAASGASVKVGALWEKSSNSDGTTFYQGNINDPSMDKPLYIAVFPREDGSMAVNWSRPRKNSGFKPSSNSETELPENGETNQQETEDFS